MAEAEEDPDPGGGVTWKVAGEGLAMVTLRGGDVLAVRSSDAKTVDDHIAQDTDEQSMGSFFRYCQDYCLSRDDDMEMLAWMCKLVEFDGASKDFESKLEPTGIEECLAHSATSMGSGEGGRRG